MSGVEIQIDLVKKIIKDWALSDDCSGTDALVGIMEILDFNPYAAVVFQGCARCYIGDPDIQSHNHIYAEPAHAASGGEVG